MMMMTLPLPRTSDTTSSRRPGRTSMIRTARGVMTLQTEVAGDPLEVVTIVDFRGRVLKSFRTEVPPALRGREAELMDFANDFHAGIEAQVHQSLEAARQRHRSDAEPELGGVVAELFVEAVQAYARQELDTARAVLRACDALQPGDPRIRAALARLEGRR